MPVTRRAIAQRTLEENLARSAREEIGSTHDFRDALLLVVHDDGQVVSGGPVTALHDEVAGLEPAVLPAGALELVVELDRRLERVDGESKRMGSAGGRGLLAAGSWIDRLRRRIGHLGRGQCRSAAVAWIAVSCVLQRCERLPVVIDSIRLEMNVSIPFESKRSQDLRNLIRELRRATVPIEIVDPQQPTPTAMPCAQVAAGGGQQRAQVKGSGRGRRESTAGRRCASGTSRRGRRTAFRGVPAAPAPRCRASQPAGLRGA